MKSAKNGKKSLLKNQDLLKRTKWTLKTRFLNLKKYVAAGKDFP